ncbi:MAG: DnaJ domain-containing protein [Candidatus Gracilibacteria bacterium]|nr:DnaJ domain-containing protein [Candidatus Gracilibacteria bacterium]MDD2909156.1 DnaJ domain-containing protein [Candidatus Gracilibacteria bacterium]
MSKNYYETLGIDKNTSEADIKKAYRKKAMEWHPDKHKGDKKAEAKFKEINEAYQTLGNSQKKKQYDNFGSAGSDFSGGQGYGGYEDLFKNARGGQNYSSSQNFDINDIFGDMFSGGSGKSSRSSRDPFGQYSSQSQTPPKKEIKPDLDVVKTFEIPIMDLILGMKLNIQTVYSENLKLTIPEGTKSGTKFKIKGKGRTSEGKTGDMFVIVDAKMPKNIPEDVKKLLDSIKYRL